VVNLRADDQAEVSARFAAHGHDRFAAGGWSRLPTAEPVLHGLTHDTTRSEARPLVHRDRNHYGITTDRAR
jgi:hypothetical protein